MDDIILEWPFLGLDANVFGNRQWYRSWEACLGGLRVFVIGGQCIEESIDIKKEEEKEE